MPEASPTCAICSRGIDPDEPDSVLAERMNDRPGYGQQRDDVWSHVGYAHIRCILRSDGFREAVDGAAG